MCNVKNIINEVFFISFLIKPLLNIIMILDILSKFGEVADTQNSQSTAPNIKDLSFKYLGLYFTA